MVMQFAVAAVLAAVPARGVEPVTWQIDAAHSEITFRVRHFVTKVPGTFKTWEGTIVANPDNLGAGGSVSVTVQTGSVDTRHERRDNHLRSPDFFAADSFPTITFISTKVEAAGPKLTVTGDLTIRGTTRPVVLDGEFTGVFGPPVAKRQRIGFAATARINRLDYGLKWNRLVEGSNMLGDDVEIALTVEAVRQ
ncbi:MAG: YceI family protein [Gemmatimonadetes bacterium]|nr:YceI family protein [Gemmatimonadota bacterium]